MFGFVIGKVRVVLSYLPILGKFFDASKHKTQSSKRDAPGLKALHENKASWNESISSVFSQLGTKIYGNLFQKSLLKLFITDDSVPGFNPQKMAPYHVKEIKINTYTRSDKLSTTKYIVSKNGKFSKQVVLTHGAKTTGRNMGKLSKKLADMGYGVLVGDSVGFGNNKDKKLNEANLFTDIKNTILTAGETSLSQPLTLISHSMGTALQVNALAQIFEDEANSGKYSIKVKDLMLISAWDKVSELVKDLHHNFEHWEKIKDAISPTDSVADFVEKNQHRAEGIFKSTFGPNWDTIESLHKLLSLNKLRPKEFRIQNLNIMHGQEDKFVSYKRSKALAESVLDLYEAGETVLPKTRYYLIADGNHFDQQVNEDETFFPISNIQEALSHNPEGIESGEASFKQPGYVRKQLISLNHDTIARTAA